MKYQGGVELVWSSLMKHLRMAEIVQGSKHRCKDIPSLFIKGFLFKGLIKPRKISRFVANNMLFHAVYHTLNSCIYTKKLATSVKVSVVLKF